MEVQIKGLNETLASLGKYKDQLPYAISRALNKTAQDVKKAEQDEMKKVFDRPTPYILKSIAIDKARKDRLLTIISLGIPGEQPGGHAPRALRAEVAGGERRIKGAEAHLRASGILPMDKYLAPARSAEYDMYGNFPPYLFVKVLSDIQGFVESGFARAAKMNRSSRSALSKQRQYYVRTINGINVGIYKRTGSLGSGSRWSSIADTPVFNFISKPHYKQRYDFVGVGRKSVEDTFRKYMTEALIEAIKTAR